jgi:hypothetical protein
MASAGLSIFTVRLKQHGYFTLRDVASSKQCSSESFLQSLGMNQAEADRFLTLRETACEVFNLQIQNQGPSNRTPPVSTATSDIVDVRLPLNVTFDKELKVLRVLDDSQISKQEVGRRVVSVAGVVVRNTKEFKAALENCKNTSSTCELVYIDARKAPPMPSTSPAATITKKPPPPPTPPPRRASQPPVPQPSKAAAEDEDEALRAAIEASKRDHSTPVKPPVVDDDDDEDEALRAAIEASKLESSPAPVKVDESDDQIMAAVLMASKIAEKEAELKRREEEAQKQLEELTLRAILAESEVTEVRGRLASTDMSMDYARARRESMQSGPATGGAVFVSGAEIYQIPRDKLKLEDEPFAKGGKKGREGRLLIIFNWFHVVVWCNDYIFNYPLKVVARFSRGNTWEMKLQRSKCFQI